MASRQLGKLRQWAGEVISSRDKTTATEEFRELEKDIELRKAGAQRLYLASELYHHALSKKKQSDALDDPGKLLPLDILGIVMIVHGEEFGEDSAFGTSLVKLGRAHCKVATLQEGYALTVQGTFLASIQKFIDDIKECDALRKKLESRRLSYDAALAKLEKAKKGKKEKDKEEAEDEAERARYRYEETSEDVRAHMHAIQENEIGQLRDLSSFLDLEINFVEKYLDVLKDVKSDWYDSSGPVELVRGDGLPHMFPRSSTSGSVRSKKSMTSSRSKTKSPISDSSEDEDTTFPPRTRKLSTQHMSDSNASKPPSRPASRTSRKRSESVGTAGGKEDREKEKLEKSRRMSVTGWASNAVGSVTGRGKKKFSALQDDETNLAGDDDDEQDSKHKRSGSQSSSRVSPKIKSKEIMSPKVPVRILKPPSLQGKKIVCAVQDFNGSSDELSFKAGDQILVVSEVLDGWWMGELDGRRGLFPTHYVQVILSDFSSSKQYAKNSGPSLSIDDAAPNRTSAEILSDGYVTSDLDEAQDLRAQPLLPTHSPFYGGPPDDASITSSGMEEEGDDDDDESLTANKLPSHSQSEKILQSLYPSQPPIAQWPSTTDNSAGTATPTRKAPPPPPPPRRSTNSVVSSTGPPIPERRPSAARNQSSSSGSLPINSIPPAHASYSSSSAGTNGYDTSPFESAAELSAVTACREFKQNPFKVKGMCSNCFEMHV